MERKKLAHIRLLTMCSLQGCDVLDSLLCQMIEQGHHIQGAEEPELGRCASSVHDGIGGLFDVLDSPFSWILILVVRFRLMISNMVVSQYFSYFLAYLCFGII